MPKAVACRCERGPTIVLPFFFGATRTTEMPLLLPTAPAKAEKCPADRIRRMRASVKILQNFLNFLSHYFCNKIVAAYLSINIIHDVTRMLYSQIVVQREGGRRRERKKKIQQKWQLYLSSAY